MKKDIKQLVTINPEKEIATTTSLLVAEKFNKDHPDVLKAIRKLIYDSEKFGISQGYISLSDYKVRGKKYPMYEMDKDFFTFLIMGFTGEKAFIWKAEYIKLFNKMIKRLTQIDKERHAVDWMQDRIDGKIQRRKFTDRLLPFVLLAEDQGHIGTARHAYSNFTKLVNKHAGINPQERDLLTSDMLRRVSFLENILETKVNELTIAGMDAKLIYSICKDTIKIISEMVPYDGTVYLPTNNLLIENK